MTPKCAAGECQADAVMNSEVGCLCADHALELQDWERQISRATRFGERGLRELAHREPKWLYDLCERRLER